MRECITHFACDCILAKLERLKSIKIDLDLPTLVFLMKNRHNVYAKTFDDGSPSIEVTLTEGEHPESLEDAIRLIELAWKNA